MKYFEIIQELKQMRVQESSSILSIKVLSNIMVHQLADILDYSLRKEQIPTTISLGNYDNIIQDASLIAQNEVVILFWEASNIVDGFQYLSEKMSVDDHRPYLEKFKNEISIVFGALGDKKKVFFNVFHSMPFDDGIVPGNFAIFVNELNTYLAENKPDNFVIIDTNSVFGSIAISESFDLRNYFSSKALYSIDFFKAYARRINPLIRAIVGKVKKVLILDCDNTLWGGILGEDGKTGIKLSTPYLMVQSAVVKLKQQGVLICLCSKNNPEDVEDVFDNHESMILKNEHILLKKVNWDDKASNIKSIALELNLGLDSFVFVDDSSFEVNLIREQLPEVKVYQVPKKSSEYPMMMKSIVQDFFHFESNKEDAGKTDQYRKQLKREEAKSTYNSVDDYLRSLDLQIIIYENNPDLNSRLAQMTQKTNQFNLCTKRYSEQDVAFMQKSGDYDFYALSVKDKYGDSGITGLAIINKKSKELEIDSLLLSCRILGRNIEVVFAHKLIELVQAKILKAKYVASPKNMQVSDFYNKIGFEVIDSNQEVTEYILDCKNYEPIIEVDYIKVEIWKKN